MDWWAEWWPQRYAHVLIPGTYEYYLAKDVIKLKILRGGATLNYPSGLHMQSHVSSYERARGNSGTEEEKIW